MSTTVRRMRATAPLAAVVLLTVGCSGLSVTSDWDPNANFSAFQTFEWLPDAESDGSAIAGDALIDGRIRAAIDSDLQSKGLRKVDDGGDLAVGYQLSLRDEVSYTTMHSGWGGYGYGYGRYRYGGGGFGTTTTTQNVSTVGQLLIAVYDETEKDLVWQGTGEKTVGSPADSPEESERVITEIVAKIMESFPPGS